MNKSQRKTVLSYSSESRKFTLADNLIKLQSNGSNEIVVAGGQAQDGKGILYCVGSDANLKWSQTFPHPIRTVNISSNGSFVGAGGEDSKVAYFTVHGEIAWQEDCRSPVNLMEISGNGRYIAVCLADGNLNYFDNDLVAARKFAWKNKFDKPPTSLSMNNDGTMVGVGTEEGEIGVFTERGDMIWTKLLQSRINKIRLASEGDAAIVAPSDNNLHLFTAEMGKNLWTKTADDVFVDADLTKKGERIVGICKNNIVYCYDKEGKEIWKYDMGSPGNSVRISNDGRSIVATSMDTFVHCLDAKGNLLWKNQVGGSGVRGTSVSEEGDMVGVLSESGILFFENLQVIGGLLPKIQHLITNAKERNIPTFKAEKLYEEGVVALNYGDYQTAAMKVREIEKKLREGGRKGKEAPPPKPEAGKPPATPAGGGTEQPEERELEDKGDPIREKIASILKRCDEVRKDGVDVEPVENLLSDAAVLLEEGRAGEAEAFVNDANEMLSDFVEEGGVDVGDAPPKPVPEKVPPETVEKEEGVDNKTAAMDAIGKATEMLSKLEETDIGLGSVKGDIETARSLIENQEFQRALASANRAIVSMEMGLEPYITECLVNVQKLMKVAENRGLSIEDLKSKLMKTREHISAGENLTALNLIRESEEWLESALDMEEATPEEEKTEKPGISIPPPPSVTEGVKPGKPAKEPEPEEPVEPGKPAKEPEPEEPVEPGKPAEEPEPEEPVEPEKPAEVPEPEEPVEPVEVPKPTIDHEKILSETTDPAPVLGEAEEALENKDPVIAIEKFMIAMEAMEERARALIKGTISEAVDHINRVKEDGFEPSQAEEFLANAGSALDSGDYKKAISDALQSIERADTVAMGEIRKIIEDSRRKLAAAGKIGVDIAMAEDMIKDAEEALENREYNVASKFASEAIEEVEEAGKESIKNILEEGKEFLQKIKEMEMDGEEVVEAFNDVKEFLDSGNLEKAHEIAKTAVEKAKNLPREFVRERINEARSKVLSIEKIGADTTMAKNHLIKARSTLAAGDFSSALKACQSSMEESAKAPKKLVDKRIASTKNDIEEVKSMGQDVGEVEDMLSTAEAKIAEEEFEGALKTIEDVENKIKEIKSQGAEATNTIFDADVAISQAREAGKDVAQENEMLNEAMSIREKDPGRAMELAKEIIERLKGE